mmetsp:Transcript_21537/g.24761  ORF Transcript_21537/g.24761 Transcript_21537/m.24761 type:complete len:153 (-) Transcript_21537:13-471(-)
MNEKLLDDYCLVESTFKSEIVKKIVEDDTNPFNDNPGDVGLVESNMLKMKSSINKLDRLYELVAREIDRNLGNIVYPSVSPSIKESVATVHDSQAPYLGTEERIRKYKQRYEKALKKNGELTDKVREAEYKLSKALKEINHYKQEVDSSKKK